MEELARIALVGTSKHAAAAAADGEHPAEAMLAALPNDDREQVFLLRAGVRAVFEQCGRAAISGVAPPSPSPPEEAACAPQSVVSLLHNALTSDTKALCIEFFLQLEARRLVLPPELLPQALDVGDVAMRDRLLPVLGERGQWLSHFNPQWKWAASGVADLAGPDRAALNRAWDEGDINERCRVLQILRGIAPAEARTLLESSIDQEKAEHRARLLETFQTGLTAEDEACLESRLDDRSELVRGIAASLLARLPESALAVRMRQRTESLFSMGKKGILRKRLTLTCQPPEEIESSWHRDGVPKKPPAGRGKRAVWTETILSAVPPSAWCERFAAEPSSLIEAVADDEFADAVVRGWTMAASVFAKGNAADAAWLRPLWDYRISIAAADQRQPQKHFDVQGQLRSLLAAMSSAEAEAALLPAMKEAAAIERICVLAMLSSLPHPWSPRFAREFLATARNVVARPADQDAYFWAHAMPAAAVALPREVFVNALEDWDLGADDAGVGSRPAIRREVDRFVEIVRMRQRFYDELEK
jgi:hypothetical protein